MRRQTNPLYLRPNVSQKVDETAAVQPSKPYERPTLHPNDPEFRRRAILWGRRDMEREPYYSASGSCVIAMGFERASNARMRAGFEAVEAREIARRMAEDEGLVWTEEHDSGWTE